MKTNIKNMTVKELETFFGNIEEKKFRAKQLFQWLYRGAYSFDEMTDLSKELREKLEKEAFIEQLKIVKIQKSKKDGTRKYLFELSDGNTIESVFMKYKFGNSVCVSSQAGCRMGCSFCASTIGGLNRNLTAAEMADQILSIEKDTGEKIGNIVVMGTGEPFDNYENLSQFIRIINSKEGLNLGMRSITVSTCGLIPKIKEFANDFPQVNLALSLHAPNDKIRNMLMPINNKYNVDELLEVCRGYINKTGRRVTFEYALVKGINDNINHAEELALKLKGMICHVNLIPLNNVLESNLKGTERDDVEKFKNVLEKKGIQVTVRREMGSDIDAACGQLRLRN
ncbi:23S rRNA (adenine(2503)-C(2))-methyltransferase RlmN [Anaerovorax odorimutans]|uniref:23S rRNA (adenine(2503)-C(2))-methyltransferase RlmN n=1 Tax=Anaerovorax odorimutans TaxID=109327 RepID=UPI0003F703FF|nr:23S rRNA (adenine(2503)-C(2))-methyltransferase RlmN [Anaerovorax odorimutans]